MENKKLSIASSVMWNTCGSTFYLGCQWLITVLVVRLAGLHAGGILTLAISVTNIWYAISVYGMRNYQVSDVKNKYSAGTYLYSRVITIGISLLGCLIYALVIPYSLEQRVCIILYFCIKAGEAVFDCFSGMFQKNWRLDIAGKSMIIRGIITIVSFSAVLYLTKNLIITLLLVALLTAVAIAIYDIPRVRKLETLKFDFKSKIVIDLLIECLPLVIYSSLSTSIASIPRLYMERILGNELLAIYGAVATPVLIIQVGATYIFNPFVTLFAEKYNNNDIKGFLKILAKCIVAVCIISVIGLVGGALVGKWGLNLLYGSTVASHVDLLIPLIICTIITAVSWLFCGVLTVIRGFKGLVISNLTAVLTSIVLSPILEKSMGMQGASLTLALATIIEIVILVADMFIILNKKSNR